MILKLGSTGNAVKILQEFLLLDADGIFGPLTQAAVKKWQTENALVPDGIIGNLTWNAMGLATTDSSELEKLNIRSYFLSRKEYIKGPYLKEWVFLHHTAGWDNPYNTIKDWENDSRGPVATEFVIGGQSIRNNDKYDGEILKSMPDGASGWHLGIGNTYMHTSSVGIEVCNFGQLTKGGYHRNNKWVTKTPEKFYTYVGSEVDISQVVTLEKKFRGFLYWHKYSLKQIKSLRDLLIYIRDRDNIDIKKGLRELIIKKGGDYAFDFCDINFVTNNKGLWTHANVIKNKVDMFPQKELIEMIIDL